MSFKNIRIPKRGGGTRVQRVQVLKSGKYKFVKNKASRSLKKKKTSKKTTRRRFGLARRKRKRGARKFTIPLAPVLGLAAGMAAPAQKILAGDLNTGIAWLSMNYTGFDPRTGNWSLEAMKAGLLPLAIGLLVHKFVGGAPLNANRMLAQANVPLVRI